MNRQERRKQERLTKKQGKKEYNMPGQLLQSWSVPVMRTSLPPDILQTMIEISDLVIADKESKNYGHALAGQIETELEIEFKILEQTGIMDFFLQTVRQFVIQCKCQQMPGFEQVILKEEWMIQMITMWIVSQQPNEYNPLHVHANCQISSVMYLKVPKMLPQRKQDSTSTIPADGSIVFVSNSSRDLDLSTPIMILPPQVGDFYIFGAQQQHAVYPYRCAEGQKETERRSISFNAIFQSKTDHDKGKQATQPRSVIKPGDTKPS